ncbi:M61 family peptidase [Sphingomonas parva]|uniref:M61 family peptidase n=1 Tax=Sphingomonas parva TaxID=2555898 RepID=A0A4Y8ZRX5_9SPHN|nr:PDZ domain-containing protein [Sphingomonas parva]TFI58227.1 M61 family peptidase [Sphingomonas parva]
MRSALLAVLLLSSAPLSAQLTPSNFTRAVPAAKQDTVPAARDIPFPGTIRLNVDVTDLARRIIRVKETIPVPAAGRMTLLYPEWLPGAHSPRGAINKVAGLQVSAGGKRLEWVRDTLDVYAFHVDVPAGVEAIDVEFQFVSPTADNQGRTVITPDMASIQWIATSLYPAGYYVRNIPIQATLTVPDGWSVATSLRPEAGSAAGSTITYRTVPYDIFVDSPAIAGAHFRKWELSPDVTLNVVADTATELEASDELIGLHRKLVDQAVKTFGAQHYDHYDFLLSISDNLGGIGLEHHRSSENGVDTGYFTEWKKAQSDRNLLPHEYTHSWNGKYRRGADLWTPDYRTPMQNSLLWVYEGQTQFWGYVLDARSGMLSKQETLDAIASIAATYDATPGRRWRPLIDTTNDPIIAQRAPQPWRAWQRSEDYYNEGLLIWLDVDRILRQQSRGKKSLDDFAKAFFGVNDRDYGELTYTQADIVGILNRLQPYDWAGYLDRRLNAYTERAPLEGIEQGGYRLVYTGTPTDWFKTGETNRKAVDLTYSGGFVVASGDGKVTSVLWDSPAFDAGLSVGSQVLAVNGRAFSADGLKAAISAAKGTREPVRLLVQSGDAFRTVDLAWHQGLRYPRLEPTAGGKGTLDSLLAPLR